MYHKKPEQHDDHVTLLYIARLEDKVKNGFFNSPHGYYDAKADLRDMKAKRAQMAPHHYDPMGFWFGMQSN